MDIDIAREWTEALVSEEFPQARDNLRTSDGYCCLGVLCELYRRKHPDLAAWDDGPRDYGKIAFIVDEKLSFSILPPEVKDWAGLYTDTGHVRGENEFTVNDDPSLANMNDAGESFVIIAARIRANAERL